MYTKRVAAAILCFAVVFGVMGGIAAPNAHAAQKEPTPTQDWLTGTQIQAILELLREFGVGPALISKISFVLIRKTINLQLPQ
ncbi:MAG: hypothetical protein AAB449_00280 [Patescibacteria group bacterium]